MQSQARLFVKKTKLKIDIAFFSVHNAITILLMQGYCNCL